MRLNESCAAAFFNCKSAVPDNVTGEGTSHHGRLTLFTRTLQTLAGVLIQPSIKRQEAEATTQHAFMVFQAS